MNLVKQENDIRHRKKELVLVFRSMRSIMDKSEESHCACMEISCPLCYNI